MSIHALVTGPTGLIGRRLVLELLSQGHTLTLAMRGAERRRPDYDDWVRGRGEDPARLNYGDFDLEDPALPEALEVDVVYHLAAVFSWGLEPDFARRVHVDASVWLTEWTARRPTPPWFIWVGGYRLALELGPRAKEGAYEASKREGHEAMQESAEALGLDWTVFHPATVFPDEETMAFAQYELGMHAMLGSLWRGELPVLPGGRDTFVPVTRVDHLARLMVGVIGRPEARGNEYYVLDPQTPQLPDFVALAARHLGVRGPWFRLPVSLILKLPKRLTGTHPEELAFLDELRERAGLDVPTYHALMQEVEQALITRMKSREQGS